MSRSAARFQAETAIQQMSTTHLIPQMTKAELRTARACDLAKLWPQENLAHITRLLEIDDMLGELAPGVYDVATGTLDPRRLADAVIVALNICDEEDARYVFQEAHLWHDFLETSCQLQDRQSV